MIKKVVNGQLSRFTIGGFINYALKLGITALLTEIAGLWYFFSYSISLISVIIFSFFYNAYITYRVTNNKKQRFFSYTSILLLFTVTDALLVRFFTEIMQIHYLASIIIVTATLFIAKYVTYKKIVFRKK